MKHKRFFILSIVLVCITFLFACANGADKEAESNLPGEKLYDWGEITGVTITIWGLEGELTRPYYTRAFEQYQKLTGNVIEAVGLPKEEAAEIIRRAFSDPDAERPDILLTYGGTNIESLDPENNFYDFTDAGWVSDLTDTALTQSIFNGRVVGLPFGESSISGTLYNKDVFKQYGIEIPRTQEEFMKACETLLENGITPLYFPYMETTMLLYQFPMDSILKDSTILDGLNNGTLSYGQLPEMKKIVQWYKTMADCGYLGTDYTQNDWNGMDAAMQNGEYAMLLCWDTWLYTSFTGDASKIGLMPAFMGVPEKGSFEGANIILNLVNKESPHLDASLDYINFMAEPSNYNYALEGMYTALVFKNQTGSVTTPQYMEAERLINELFYDSTAWLRVRGFSQMDASYIKKYMQEECSLEECLDGMDTARRDRAGIVGQVP